MYTQNNSRRSSWIGFHERPRKSMWESRMDNQETEKNWI